MAYEQSFDKEMFADIAPYWGERLRSFLSNSAQVEHMIRASEQRRPAAEAIAEPLYETFGEDVKANLIKRYIGYLIKQVMRKHGYSVAERNVQTRPNPVFNKASVYAPDPALRRTMHATASENFARLKAKYHATSHTNSSPESPLFAILEDINTGNPLDDIQIQWLRQHELKGTLACSYQKAFETSHDPWDLVKASRYWREADDPARALGATEGLLERSENKNGRLKAAILTTRGAAIRDQGRLAEAEQHAEQARKHDPSSWHPYNLLGAIYFEGGQPQKGEQFFRATEDLGCGPNLRDRTIKSALARASLQDQRAVAEYLLKTDRVRYAWAREYCPDCA